MPPKYSDLLNEDLMYNEFNMKNNNRDDNFKQKKAKRGLASYGFYTKKKIKVERMEYVPEETEEKKVVDEVDTDRRVD